MNDSISDVGFIAGVLLLGVGVGLVSIPAALVVAGLVLTVGSVAYTRGKRGKP